MSVCVRLLVCIQSMCTQCLWRSIEGTGSPELLVQVVVGVKNQCMLNCLVISMASCLLFFTVLDDEAEHLIISS